MGIRKDLVRWEACWVVRLTWFGWVRWYLVRGDRLKYIQHLPPKVGYVLVGAALCFLVAEIASFGLGCAEPVGPVDMFCL